MRMMMVQVMMRMLLMLMTMMICVCVWGSLRGVSRENKNLTEDVGKTQTSRLAGGFLDWISTMGSVSRIWNVAAVQVLEPSAVGLGGR